jgi:hypothetical protein
MATAGLVGGPGAHGGRVLSGRLRACRFRLRDRVVGAFPSGVALRPPGRALARGARSLLSCGYSDDRVRPCRAGGPDCTAGSAFPERPLSSRETGRSVPASRFVEAVCRVRVP